ncbi:MAG: glycoside hydrolase family 2 TIM barrel-domain containing protein, partial [Eubacteriales bacterium]|nr:glycoside hydrolase family 2 TIM barrel-domain containing protein [Eubacteriales bacterium]
MKTIPYDLGYLTDPRVFAVGRLPACSDHEVFANDAEAAAGQSSLRLSLNGRWKFAYSENPDVRPVGFEAAGYDCSTWNDITVPGHIQLQGWGKPQYVNIQYPWDGHEAVKPPQVPVRHNPVGSYVTAFHVPEAWAGRRVTLVFNGVESAFFVWVNGVLLGYAEDSFTPSRFDITDALVAGENRLAVEVYRFCSGSWLEDQDFWRFSGIFRTVELKAEPRAHVSDLFVHALPAEDLQTATLTAELALSLPNEPVSVRATLLDAQGRTADECTLLAESAFRFIRTLQNPALWSAEQPNLYTLRLTLLDSRGNALETAQTEVGFRRVEIRGGMLKLNGKRVVFHGVDRHEFCHTAGRALSEADMLWDMRTLKRNNINAVRTSHYPNQSLWYKLCDRYGIYLIDETNLETHGTWGLPDRLTPEDALPGNREEWLPACLDRARSMLERDKNHASVLLWSCGNESFGGSVLFQMSQFFRERDPSRAVHYEGVFNDRRYNDTSDVESRMYPPAAEIAEWLDSHTDKPYLLCEYSHAMGNSCGGLADYIALESRYPQYQGGFIWDWVDQALETSLPGGGRALAYGGDFTDQPNDRTFCGNGLLFADRAPTPKLQEVKYLYQPVRVAPGKSGVTL